MLTLMAADRKEQILNAAYEIVGTEGLEGLHARSVAAKVGVNHAAVHYYFPKRSDLLLATAEHSIKRFATDREKLLANSRTVTARIDAHLAQAGAYGKPNSRFIKNWVSFFIAAISEKPIKNALAQHLRDWTELASKQIAEGTKTGAVRRASPFVDAELLVAALVGLVVFAQTIGTGFDMDEKLDTIATSLLA